MSKLPPPIYLFKSLFLFLSLVSISTLGFSRENDDIINNKANFILEVAYNISYSKTSNDRTYEIGVYGRDSEAKALFSKLNEKVENLSIDGKPISVKLFKNMRSVLPVDIIYISGNTKVRLGDLHDKLSVNNYSMITEDYPFGSSAINFSLDKDDKVIFEIQEIALRNNGAELRRKILKNRQRIQSSKDWKLAVENGSSKSKSYKTSQSLNIEQQDSIIDSTLIDTIPLENKISPKTAKTELNCDCQKEIDNATSNANRKFYWLLIISLLSIGGLGYYIYKLKQG